MLYVVFAMMLLAAALIAAAPLYRKARLVPGTIVFILLSVGLAVGIYARIGSPDAPSGRAEVPNIEEMVKGLDARLQENPDDVAGWKMLGRSYVQLEDLQRAIAAFEKAVELEDGRNGETLISLGEAVFLQDQTTLAGRAGQLFESGLSMSPANPQGLFYGGLAALQRGDRSLAADRWESLLALAPPPEIASVLEQRVAELRGTAVVEPPAESAAAPAVVEINISLSDAVVAATSADASVFIIARDPAQPSPPIAVTRRQAGEMPAVVSIGDSDAMIPGRIPSGYEELEIVVRVSASGQPIPQSGDWFGSVLVQPKNGAAIDIVVDQQVP